MIRIFVFILFLIPGVLFAQKSKKAAKKNQMEQQNEIVPEDSLQIKLSEKQKTVLTEEDRVQQMIEKYGKNKGRLIAAGKVWTSISPEMALDAWGEPLKKQKTELQNKVSERWTYPDGRFLYFENGMLHSWRE